MISHINIERGDRGPIHTLKITMVDGQLDNGPMTMNSVTEAGVNDTTHNPIFKKSAGPQTMDPELEIHTTENLISESR